VAAAREAITDVRPTTEHGDPMSSADAEVHPDDPDVDDSGMAPTELLQSTLGAQVIEEIPHQ
jgi:DNA polymerase-3 subunit gamma/tau